MLNNTASGTMIPLALKQESIRLKGEGAYQWGPCVPSKTKAYDSGCKGLLDNFQNSMDVSWQELTSAVIDGW
jgi:hypothetical protein